MQLQNEFTIERHLLLPTAKSTVSFWIPNKDAAGTNDSFELTKECKGHKLIISLCLFYCLLSEIVWLHEGVRWSQTWTDPFDRILRIQFRRQTKEKIPRCQEQKHPKFTDGNRR
jgi:hypothetical protein